MSEINHSSDNAPRSRSKKSSNTILYFFIFTVILLTAGFYVYLKNIESTDKGTSSNTAKTSLEQDASGTVATGADSGSLTKNSALSSSETDNTNLTSLPTTGNKQLQLGDGQGSQTSNADQQSGSFESTDQITTDQQKAASAETIDPQTLITVLNTFYSHLDSVAYMKDFNLTQPSKEHFSKLIQKLLDNPPIVTRETDDLFTLLKNTAHFFRILGKKNILILKGILDREKNSFEEILQSLYMLTSYPEALNKEYSVRIHPDALYDYAGFFMHTMGGRLYLFRRDSNSRMVVSYYAIRIIDDANMSGNSRHGIDIRPGIASLIEEIENGGNTLHMREMYLDKLYDLQEKYN